MTLEEKLLAAKEILRNAAPVLVAYSGGVDSSTLLAIAVEAGGCRVEAAIADSPSLPRKSLENALRQAQDIGAKTRVLPTGELEISDYASNPPNRCYFCKKELFSKLEKLAKSEGFASIAYGENADDLAVDRPGHLAAQEFSVLAPLRMAGITKKEVRALAVRFGLSSAELPAQPCLSSRIPFGTRVTKTALERIEKAEEIVRSYGFRVVRVRHAESDAGPAAKVLVGSDETKELAAVGTAVCEKLKLLGFGRVELDPVGYQGFSG